MLQHLGIDSYLLGESCRNGRGKARGVMPPLDALYTDLRNLRKVFDAEDRAEALISSFQERVAEAQAKAPKGAGRPRVFLYDSGEDKPFTSGAFAGPHDIITKAGGDHNMPGGRSDWARRAGAGAGPGRAGSRGPRAGSPPRPSWSVSSPWWRPATTAVATAPPSRPRAARTLPSRGEPSQPGRTVCRDGMMTGDKATAERGSRCESGAVPPL